MTIATPAPVLTVTLLRLGRVSNLPTVWTNVLAGTALAGGDWNGRRSALVLLAMSLFYVGGMYLNDYFDRAIDAGRFYGLRLEGVWMRVDACGHARGDRRGGTRDPRQRGVMDCVTSVGP